MTGICVHVGDIIRTNFQILASLTVKVNSLTDLVPYIALLSPNVAVFFIYAYFFLCLFFVAEFWPMVQLSSKDPEILDLGAYHEYLTSHLSHLKRLTSHLSVILVHFSLLSVFILHIFHCFTFSHLRLVSCHSSHLSHLTWLAPLNYHSKRAPSLTAP